MRTPLMWALALLLAGAGPVLGADPEVKTDEQKTFYALGLALGQNLASFTLSAAELELVKAGLNDAVLNRERKVDLQIYGPKLQQLQRERATAAATTEKKAGQAFLDKAAAEKGATKTKSGLVITTLKAGTGQEPLYSLRRVRCLDEILGHTSPPTLVTTSLTKPPRGTAQTL